ncbi:PTS glucose transporter subunit IIA [Spiroplasma tabanidicola]|uniref:PTS system, beta-glucoside-specific IIA component n=1 Tax=Spiroplasma tabanidicola TaxID=324079 RepID=A0A6I6CJM1_9MOLU|nr:PTS glucose transporter subunit IIABC [Spiroplasma tabanidicola]QGS52283.1 PTS system, beta-glucoside-specific IIA component [Spiroplasma tabanidicola]
MEIKVYAPQDCTLKDLDKSVDQAFASKSMGDGFLLVLEQKEFYCPFEKAKVNLVWETKHAYILENQKLNLLIHCGIDSVNLKGKPFKTDLKTNDIVKKENKLFEVNLEKFKKNNIPNECPFIFSSDENKIEKINYKEGKYKKGDLICTIELVQKDKPEIIQVSSTEKLALVKSESKYNAVARKILENVGSFINFKQVYNCMTRVRFRIINKCLVNENKIKETKMVKGINWIGDELQIIVGAESANIKEEILRIKEEDSKKEVQVQAQKTTVGQKIMGGLSGIIGPNIRVLVASGILALIYSLLVQFKLAKDLGDGTNMQDADVLSVVLYAMTKVGILLVGLFFCITSTKYFGGNYLLGVFVGLILVSRFFMAKNGITNPDDYSVGKFVENSQYGSKGWFLFSIGDYPVVVKSYEGSVLPFVFAGFLAAKLEKLFKKFLTPSLEMVFGSGLVVITTILPVLFVFGPALSLLELGVTKVISGVEKIPYGFGPAILALVWQPLVITGLHVPINVAIGIPVLKGEPTLLYPANTLAMFAQIGMGIGIAIFTKNKNLRRVSIAAIPSGIFGITEPVIYGVNLPKIKPFLWACVAAFLVTMLSTNLDLKQDIPVGGPGIFYPFTNFTKVKDQILYFGMVCLVMGVAILFAFLFYKERFDETKYSTNIFRKVSRLLKLKYNDLSEENLKKVNELKLMFKENKKTFKEYEKYIQKVVNLNTKISNIEDSEANKKNKMYLKIQKIYNNPNVNIEKVNNLIVKYEEYNLENQKNLFKDKLINVENDYKELANRVKSIKDTTLTKCNEYIDWVYKNTDKKEFNEYKNGFWNAINSVEIGYGLEELMVLPNRAVINKEVLVRDSFKTKVSNMFAKKGK